ncbi:MAG: hypothetical protein LBB67_03440 [Oscillospiraceae bacterium]|jgi:hypothetical protein|nr:hypothetical protein [Oscillospiraceae bacterium]
MSALGKIIKIAQNRFTAGSDKVARRSPVPVLPSADYDAIPEPLSDHYTLGFAKTDIMPSDIAKKKYWVAGYRINNPATGVQDPMTASAVWLDDNSGRGGIFMISIDNVGMSSYDSDIIKESMREDLTQMHCRGVYIFSTHNHAGIDTLGYWGRLPRTGRDPKYMAILHDGVRRVMRAAYRARKDGELFHGTIEAPDVLRDTRPPEVFSKTITRFRFAPSGGGRETWLINLASHSESMLGHNSLISADFPCYMRREILEKADAEAIYFVGAIGGQIRPKDLDENNVISTIQCGVRIAERVMQMTDERKLRPIVNLITQPFYLEAENIMLLAAAKINIFRAKRRATGDGALGYSIETEMSYVNIDGVPMLFLPGELFPELAYGGFLSAEESGTGLGPEINPPLLTDIAQDKNLLIFGLCNDMTGYIVSPNDWYLHPEEPYINGGVDRHGAKHYEETNSLGPRTAYVIADQFAKIMSIVRQSAK